MWGSIGIPIAPGQCGDKVVLDSVENRREPAVNLIVIGHQLRAMQQDQSDPVLTWIIDDLMQRIADGFAQFSQGGDLRQ